jgi:hypothetical protein
MSAETVEWILGRALTNAEYRERLLESPLEAVAGYQLTPEEIPKVTAWTRQQFDELIYWLDEKVSQAVFNGSLGFEFDKGLDRVTVESIIEPADLERLFGTGWLDRRPEPIE